MAMGNLSALNKYFVKYKWRLLLGLLFVTISNLFAAIPATIVRDVIDEVQKQMSAGPLSQGVVDSVANSGNGVTIHLKDLGSIALSEIRQVL